jgi:hypothetical protein
MLYDFVHQGEETQYTFPCYRAMIVILGAVYMEAGLARLARQPGNRDEFLLCLYEKISSRLPGQSCCFDIDLTVVKNSLRRYL